MLGCDYEPELASHLEAITEKRIERAVIAFLDNTSTVERSLVNGNEHVYSSRP